MEPIIQAGHEALVHHIILYACYQEINDTWNGHTGQCYTTDMTEFSDCQAILGAWAIGGPVSPPSCLSHVILFGKNVRHASCIYQLW